MSVYAAHTKNLAALLAKQKEPTVKGVRFILKVLRNNKGKSATATLLSLFTYSMCRDHHDMQYIKPIPTVCTKPRPIDHHKYTLRNKVWTEEELEEVIKTAKQHHKPSTVGQFVLYGMLKGAYNLFNFVTRFDPDDPTEHSMQMRLILLESIAGIPPFIMSGYRHFRSLRNLSYDGGRIYTHLEEAENERMHLVSCMQMFGAGSAMKMTVYTAQLVTTPVLWMFCLISPRSLNRFVGYLEELACETYSTVLINVNNPKKKLHQAWHDKPAPPVAREYWDMGPNATWPQVLRYIYADETNHRDINHKFADISVNAKNPLLHHHVDNFERSVADTTEKEKEQDE